MEKKNDARAGTHLEKGMVRSDADIAALQDKWGVSAEEIRSAIDNVGNNQSNIEEYLVNARWKTNDEQKPSFQKRDLNEDETY